MNCLKIVVLQYLWEKELKDRFSIWFRYLKIKTGYHYSVLLLTTDIDEESKKTTTDVNVSQNQKSRIIVQTQNYLHFRVQFQQADQFFIDIMPVSDTKKSPSKKKGDGESKINEIISEGTGQVVKMEVDCSAIVEEKIPQADKLAKENKLTEALELLLSLEKQTRSGSDMHSTSKVLVKIVQICYEVPIVVLILFDCF